MIEALRVLEIAGSVAGGYAAKLLADRGAMVTVASGALHSTQQWGTAMGLYLNDAKRELTVSDNAELLRLGAEADIVIQSSAPGPLVSVLDRFEASDRLIDVRISPFGSGGPLANHRSTDLTDQAVSGHLFLNGDPDREPLRGPEHQVAYAAGAHAAIGALAAARARSITGQGQQVEVTHHEVMTALHQFTLLRYTHNGNILTRGGNRYAGPGSPVGVYRCGDGLISLIAPRGDQLETLVAIAGLDHLIERPDIDNIYDLMHHPTLLDEHLTPWLAVQDLDETIELLQAVRVPAASVSNMADLLDDQHLAARGYWAERNYEGQNLRAPGSPFTVTAGPLSSDQRSSERAPRSGSDLDDGPLTGIRVLDLTRVWAGPCATRILADLGADVIMVEAPWARGPATIDEISVMATRYYPDNEPGDRHWNRIGFSNKYNINKRGLALDLTKPPAIKVLETLITESDVLIENYSPRVMPQLGLDEQRLHELNSSLVYITMPGFGRSGPSRDHVAYGPIIDSQAGLSVLMGYQGESARKAGVAWPDPVAGMHAAFATIAALVDRAEDGRGRTAEVAQIEATVAMAGHAIIGYELTGKEASPIGNRHQLEAPSGVYRCLGRDRWLAVSVVDDAGWIGLCRTARFDRSWEVWSAAERRSQHDEIDRAITAWTSLGEQVDLVLRLQAVGVAAAAVADAAQVMTDAHHDRRQFFVDIAHPEAGTHAWPRLPVRLSDTPATYRRAGPTLNQHAGEILGQLVGLDDAAIAELYDSGAISDRPPDASD